MGFDGIEGDDLYRNSLLFVEPENPNWTSQRPKVYGAIPFPPTRLNIPLGDFMRKAAPILILALFFVFVPHARAQQFDRVEIFGGYSFLNIDTNGLSSRQNANGWEVSAAGNFNRWFAIEGDGAGYYKTYKVDLSAFGLGTLSANVRDYSFAGGPRFSYRPVFFHALFGDDNLKGSSSSQSGLAAIIGGGVEPRISSHLPARVSADYALTHHNIFGGPRTNQNNVWVSAGIVFTFGRTGADVARSSPASQTQSGPSSEAALLGVSGYATDIGFKNTAVRPGSPAEQIFLKPADLVSKIDGREVHSSGDIEAAIAASQTGRVTVSCLIQTAVGIVDSERVANVR
jgi:Outer membrane protein beta-barrel domain